MEGSVLIMAQIKPNPFLHVNLFGGYPQWVLTRFFREIMNLCSLDVTKRKLSGKNAQQTPFSNDRYTTVTAVLVVNGDRLPFAVPEFLLWLSPTLVLTPLSIYWIRQRK